MGRGIVRGEEGGLAPALSLVNSFIKTFSTSSHPSGEYGAQLFHGPTVATKSGGKAGSPAGQPRWSANPSFPT